ncbi:MAG TPA: NAD-binding protein [Acidimicrobiia bacterium]|nr:NAD-binding protein [Acidimicrobiia bacterium]
MKFLAAITAALAAPLRGGTVKSVARITLVILSAVAVFSVGFQVVMATEGREFSWPSAVYWTVVTMTTLGFGDIVFTSDTGRMYSIVVLLVGAVLILVLLPFTFIQLIYLPWREALREAQTPRNLPSDTKGHLILTGLGSVEEALIQRATRSGMPYVLLAENTEEALRFAEAGYRVMVGAFDEPETYRAARAEEAAMVFSARSDERNSNIVFTVREVTERAIVVATAQSEDAVDVLHLAGADHVLQLGRSLGYAFARRILTADARSSEISRFDDLVIAEASASGTELVGKTLAELEVRNRFGVSVVGLWDRGRLHAVVPHLRIGRSSILLLAGSEDSLAAYDASVAPHDADSDQALGPVLIIGGGRVGRAAARALTERSVPFRVVEKIPDRVRHLDPSNVVIGDASDLDVLRAAGLDDASAVMVTTHDDDTNVFLTLYCRRLREDLEILGRARVDRNVSTLHRAGADFVLSYAATGAIEIWNVLKEDSTLLLARGLVVFRLAMPSELQGKHLGDIDIPAETGCTVIALVTDKHAETQIDGNTNLRPDADLLLIGDERAEERFLERYVARSRNRVGQRLARLIGRQT